MLHFQKIDARVPPFLFQREKLIQSSEDSVRYQNYRYRRQDSASGQYTGNGRFEGYVMELLERMRSVIRGIDFEFQMELVPDGKYGAAGGYSKIWNGMVGEVVRRKADVAVGPLSITGSRKSAVDFTIPFMSSGIQALTLNSNYVKHDPFRIIYPFSIEVWFISIFVFFLSAAMLYGFNRFDPYEWKATADKEMTAEENAKYFSFKNSLWFCTSTLFLQGSDSSPRSNAGRCIAGFWLLFLLFMVFLYLTNLTFFVTSNKTLSFINGPSDLKAQKRVKYGTVFKGDTYHIMKKTAALQGFWHKMNNDHADVYVKDIREGVERVRTSDGLYALLGASPQLRYIASQKPCDVQVVGAYIHRTQYAFAVAKDSPMRDYLSSALDALRESGVLEDLQRDWWDLDDRTHRCRNLTTWERSGAYSLLVNDLSGVYYMMAIGIAASFITFVAEIIIFKIMGGGEKNSARGKKNTEWKNGGGGGGDRGQQNDGGAKGGGNMWI